VITTTTGRDGVQVIRNRAYNCTIPDPQELGNLHDLYHKVAPDQQQTTLTRRGTNAGETKPGQQ